MVSEHGERIHERLLHTAKAREAYQNSALFEAGGSGLIVDARIRHLVRLADVRGVEHFYL